MSISIKQYREFKRKLQKYEYQNYNKIYIIPCNGDSDWHELAERSALKADNKVIENYLKDELELTMHPKKRYCQSIYKGVPFFGCTFLFALPVSLKIVFFSSDDPHHILP